MSETVSAQVNIGITVLCADCGAELDVYQTTDRWGDPVFKVDPCECTKQEAHSGTENDG